MLIGVVAKTRNGRMLRFRKERNLSQSAAAKLANTSHMAWNQLECMRYGENSVSPYGEVVKNIANLVDCNPEDIYPPEARGLSLGYEKYLYKDARLEYLLTQEKRFILPSPLEIIENIDIKPRILDMIQTLTYREREILKLRYGIETDHAYTLKEVGKMFKITKDRVRQIEATAIRKLQHPIRTAKLTELLDDLVAEAKQ